MPHQNPKLSVIVTTWNNQRFIGSCLQSILDQHVPFSIEVLVGNDASTDGTAQIVKEYQEQYPDIIQFFDRPKNLGTSKNFVDLLYRAKGEFIAQVDGDDRLCDPEKFSLQVNFLESHPECAICFHHYANYDSDGNALKQTPAPFDSDTITDINLLMKTGLGPGNTTVFRRDALPKMPPEWLVKCGNHKDFAVQFLVASKGKIGYMNRIMSIYNIHETNVTKIESFEKLIRNSILINKGFLAYHKELGITEYTETLKAIINQRLLRLAFFFLDTKQYFKFFVHLFNALILNHHWNVRMIKDAIYEVSPDLAHRMKRLAI